MRGKKGVSEVVAYVLLIVIAVSISLLVYSWLKGYIIKPEIKCPDEMSLTIKEYYCNDKILNITLKNTGLFNIEGTIIRVGNISQGKAVYFLGRTPLEKEIYFINEENTLAPGKEYPLALDYSRYNNLKKIEVQPFEIEDKVIICENAIIKQDLQNC